MHMLVLLFILCGALYLIYRNYINPGNIGLSSRSTAKPEATSDISKTLEPAFISDGKLFVHQQGQGNVHIESKYAEGVRSREANSKKQAAWKEGTTWDTSFTQMRGMGERHGETNIQFSSLTRVGDTRLMYFLKGAGFGGLFEYDLQTGNEQRILNSQNLDYQDISPPNSQGQVLLSSMYKDGSANIAISKPHDNEYAEVTGGDTTDSAPSWVVDRPNHIVYQSQGLARDPDGYIKGVGPAEVILLDTESGSLETIFANDDTDYLQPQVSSNGSLYFIKRPYETAGYASSNVVLDALLFPFRLLRAIFHYLNFFSLMYSRKPLTSAGGPKVSRDIKDVMLQGRRIDAEKALRQHSVSNSIPSLVPADWTLVRCDKNGKQEVLATHVASYSMGEDNNIVYSTGCAVFYISPNGEHQRVLQQTLINEITI